MNANKQLINLAGILLVVAIVVAGVALIAIPMWSQSQTTNRSADQVQQTNVMYSNKVTELRTAQVDEANLDAEIATLQSQIPGMTQYDDVFEIVANVATEMSVTIETVAIADSEAFAPRVAMNLDGTPVETAPAPATDAAATDGAETEAAPVETVPAPTDGADDPQRQSAVTITVAVPDMTTATAFIDALDRGPRLLAPINADYADGVLTLTTTTFFRKGE